jgi:16S rRNA (cytosine967-C5)-methyltransferase
MGRQRFREVHLFAIIQVYESQELPLDRVISGYFRGHPSLGAHDRREIGETLYQLFRWRGLLDGLGAKSCWKKRLRLLMTLDLAQAVQNRNLPAHIRCSYPEDLFNFLVNSLGFDRAFQLALISNEQAPTTVRVNTLKKSRESLLKEWGHLGARPCLLSDVGIVLPKRVPLLALPEFRKGWFELQDEGSQLVAAQVAAKPGDLVLDYCAGSGGKSLAVALGMGGRGQLFLYDVRKEPLHQAKLRLRRAGVQNTQIIHSYDTLTQKLRGKMDWVIVDAPCSGTGTLRRNVDAKWRLSRQRIEGLVALQRTILAQAVTFVRPGGRLLYATCSVLPEENERQMKWLQGQTGLTPVQRPFSAWPTSGGMDGFFAAVLAQ